MKRNVTQKVNTKERIKEIALDLFSVYGYSSVSIRDICKKLGFTESSIYYHFKNKQAIMDALLDEVLHLAEEMISEFDRQFQTAAGITSEEMCMVAVGELTGYLLNPRVFKMISMLSLERMSDSNANDIYQKIVFDLPAKQHEKVFSQMIEKNIIKPKAPSLLSIQYYSIIYFSFQKNCVGTRLSEEVVKTASAEVYSGIHQFFEELV